MSFFIILVALSWWTRDWSLRSQWRGHGFDSHPSCIVRTFPKQAVGQARLAISKALVTYTLILVVLASVTASKKYLRGQIVIQLRSMYLMIRATLKPEYGQVVVKTQY